MHNVTGYGRLCTQWQFSIAELLLISEQGSMHYDAICRQMGKQAQQHIATMAKFGWSPEEYQFHLDDRDIQTVIKIFEMSYESPSARALADSITKQYQDIRQLTKNWNFTLNESA